MRILLREIPYPIYNFVTLNYLKVAVSIGLFYCAVNKAYTFIHAVNIVKSLLT